MFFFFPFCLFCHVPHVFLAFNYNSMRSVCVKHFSDKMKIAFWGRFLVVGTRLSLLSWHGFVVNFWTITIFLHSFLHLNNCPHQIALSCLAPSPWGHQKSCACVLRTCLCTICKFLFVSMERGILDSHHSCKKISSLFLAKCFNGNAIVQACP